jgi:hypothetical protein
MITVDAPRPPIKELKQFRVYYKGLVSNSRIVLAPDKATARRLFAKFCLPNVTITAIKEICAC